MKKKNSYKRFILKMSAGAIIGMVWAEQECIL